MKGWWMFSIVILLLSCNPIDDNIKITYDKVGHIIVPLVINGIEIDGIFDKILEINSYLKTKILFT